MIFMLCFIWLSCSELHADWTFKNSAAGVNYITVTPSGSDDDTPFTLYYGQSHTVTWSGHSQGYRGKYSWSTNYNTRSSAKGSYPVDYDSLQETVFYTKY